MGPMGIAGGGRGSAGCLVNSLIAGPLPAGMNQIKDSRSEKVKFFRTALGLLCLLGIFAAAGLHSPAHSKSPSPPPVESLPPTGDDQVAPLEVPQSKEPRLTQKQLLSLLRQRVKYVFVLYQENRSFDSYFGTFPGVE